MRQCISARAALSSCSRLCSQCSTSLSVVLTEEEEEDWMCKSVGRVRLRLIVVIVSPIFAVLVSTCGGWSFLLGDWSLFFVCWYLCSGHEFSSWLA